MPLSTEPGTRGAPHARWPEGVGRRVLDEVDSTNAEAARLAAGALLRPQWVLALRQTAGRGRQGRAWTHPEGNFAATLALPLSDAPDRLALRSFVASLALFDALVALSGRAAPFSLKWPNDVLANGGKLAGILLESPRPGVLLIGIGVNLRGVPADAEGVPGRPGAHPPVSLLEVAGVAPGPEEFLDVLAPAFGARERQFAARGFAPIRAQWLSRAARLGRTVTACPGSDAAVTGRFETLDAQGRLVLSTAQGRRVIPAADVYF